MERGYDDWRGHRHPASGAYCRDDRLQQQGGYTCRQNGTIPRWLDALVCVVFTQRRLVGHSEYDQPAARAAPSWKGRAADAGRHATRPGSFRPRDRGKPRREPQDRPKPLDLLLGEDPPGLTAADDHTKRMDCVAAMGQRKRR